MLRVSSGRTEGTNQVITIRYNNIIEVIAISSIPFRRAVFINVSTGCTSDTKEYNLNDIFVSKQHHSIPAKNSYQVVAPIPEYEPVSQAALYFSECVIKYNIQRLLNLSVYGPFKITFTYQES